MSAIKDLVMMNQEAKTTGDYSSIQDHQIRMKFKEKWKAKKYAKINDDVIYDYDFSKSKLVISETYYQKLKTRKVALQLIMVLKSYFKTRTSVQLKDLIKLGFKKTTLKLEIKRLVKLGILSSIQWEGYKRISLVKRTLRKPGEKFWILKGEFTWKIFLLYGLERALIYSTIQKKSKKINRVKYDPAPRSKVLMQNAYFKIFKWTRNKLWRMLNDLCSFLEQRKSKVFKTERKQTKKFITCKNKRKKFIGYEFYTERYLLMRI